MDTESRIVQRAEEVRRVGTYLGLFEWVVWGEMHGCHVHLLLGDHVTDIRACFAPGLPALVSDDIHRVAGVWSSHGLWLSAVRNGVAVPQMNHFVIGVAKQGSASAASSSCLDAAASSSAEGSAAAGAHAAASSSAEGSAAWPAAIPLSAQRCAMRAGWLLKATEARGNCGIDAMAYHGGRSRTPAALATLREELADAVLQRMVDPAWHDVFLACQEGAGPKPAAKKKTRGAGVAKVGGMGPAMPPAGATAAAGPPPGAKAASSLPPGRKSGFGLAALRLPLREQRCCFECVGAFTRSLGPASVCGGPRQGRHGCEEFGASNRGLGLATVDRAAFEGGTGGFGLARVCRTTRGNRCGLALARAGRRAASPAASA